MNKRPQEKYDKKNMAFVNAKYKKEFVQEFKEACKKLYKLVSTKVESDTATEIEDDIDLSQNIDMSDVPSFDD